jgi:hypothetical protein
VSDDSVGPPTVNVEFHRDGAVVTLAKEEYIFLCLTLSHVLYGLRIADHDFRNILRLPREVAEEFLARIDAQETAARAGGQHWNPSPPASP